MFFPKEEMGTIVDLFITRGGEVRGQCGVALSGFLVKERAEAIDLAGGGFVRVEGSPPETHGDTLPYKSICRMSDVPSCLELATDR